LPGGKVDEHESSLEAAQREASEEVGLLGGSCQYLPLFSGVCPGEVTYWVTTYLWVGDPVLLEELCVESGLAMGWKSWVQLCDQTISPFAGYNTKVALAYAEYLRGSL
jgi:8-oxo-dGTP pyrophosphatase MutT (NUDIX family)